MLLQRFAFTVTALLTCMGQAPCGDQSDVESDTGVVSTEPENETQAVTHPDPVVDALLDRMQDAADTLQTLRATLRYDVTNELVGDQQRRFGLLQYAAPDDETRTRFNVHFDRLLLDGQPRPIDERYVFDGTWLAEVNASQMTWFLRRLVEPQNNADPFRLGDGPLPLPLGLQKADLLARFDVQPTEEANTLLLTPQPEASLAADTLLLRLDAATALPVSIQAENFEAGEVTTITLLNTEPNAELAEDAFRVDPPDEPGWTIEVIE